MGISAKFDTWPDPLGTYGLCPLKISTVGQINLQVFCTNLALLFFFILFRLVLRCRQDARVKFAKMRSDVLVKMELLDQKHGKS